VDLRDRVLFRGEALFREDAFFREEVVFREAVLFREEVLFRTLLPRRFRVAAAFRADADRAALGREADARPPFFPPFREGARFGFFPRPEPLFLPPPDSLFSVAHARRSASLRGTPRSSYDSSMCRARRRCFAV
jgi:hypothetical protein